MRIQRVRSTPMLRVEFALTACVMSALLLPPHAWAQAREQAGTQATPDKTQVPAKVQTTIEIGVRARRTDGSHPAKFQETRDVPEGLLIQKLKMDFKSSNSPYYLVFTGFEIGELDQRFTADAGKSGRYRAQFVWDQVPHAFGTGTSFFQNTAPGLYQVSPALRARLQAVTQRDDTATPVNGALPDLVRLELLTAPTTEVGLRRDQALFRQEYRPSEAVEFHAQLSRLRNRGSRPMSAGTFVRRSVPGGGLADIGGSWEGVGFEFVEPLDHRTTDLNAGAQFAGKRWTAGVDYDLSLFRNRIGSLIVENPFRLTDEQGCVVITPPALTCGASNRFRMVRWQADLAPNNDSHTVSVRANADLTRRTHLRGLFSLAYLTQNDPFLPWTLNTAIVPLNWDALSPVNDPTDVGELPARSLNGTIRHINQDYALVNRGTRARFQVRYRSQDRDYQTHTLEFPGFAAFGDTTWRSARTDFYNLPIENLEYDSRRQNVSAGFQWEILSPQGVLPQPAFLSRLTWKMDYEAEIWNRKFRDVNRNNDHSIRSRLDVKTRAGLGVKADYRYSDRRGQAYNAHPLSFNTAFPGSPAGGPATAWEVLRTTVMTRGVPQEFNLMRRFDQSDRIRNDASVTLEMSPSSRTSSSTTSTPSRANFSATYRYLSEAYDKNLYGRTANLFAFVDAQFSYAFENGGFLFASYSRDTNRLEYRSLAHLLPNPPAPPGAIVQGVLAQFPIANTWERTSRSSQDGFEVGINAAAQEGKLELDISYALSFARNRISTVNPHTVRADSVLHAGAFPYPDTVVRRQDLNISISRTIRESLELGMRYWYEPFTLDDFSFNALQPYVHGISTSEAPKLLFLDARYGSYRSNVFSLFLRYSFGSTP